MSRYFVSAREDDLPPAPEPDYPALGADRDLVFLRDSGEKTIRELLPYYLAYCHYELHHSDSTIRHRKEGLLRVIKVLGDITPQQLGVPEVLSVKADLSARGVRENWARGVSDSLRSFLRFANLVLGLKVLDPKAITMPRIPRRDVVYLTPEEIDQFLKAIPIYDRKRRVKVRWLCCRALAEALLASGMRISEALSLTRSAVNFESGEASIIGKGNKQRVVFFTPRSLGWLKEYIRRRTDRTEQLFALPDGRPLTYDLARIWFSRIRKRSGLKKVVTPHILRHTCATTLLFNGCPIGHIKEILGHDRLETTCRYYLGVDRGAAKEAQRKYFHF